MQAVSSQFLNALTGSHRMVARVDAWRNGVLLSPDEGLPISAGQVTITTGQAIRTAVSVTVTDPDGLWTPAADGALSPYGSELHVSLGVQVGALTELCSLCWSPITVASTEERWQAYRRVDQSTVQVSRGASTAVTATDRAQVVAAAKFLARTQPQAATVFGEIAQLLQGIVPWRAPTLIADAAIPAGITYEDDRLKAVADVAAVVHAELIFDASGTATLGAGVIVDADGIPNPVDGGTSVWTIPSQQDTNVSFTRELNADNTYNGMIVRGTSFGGQTIVGQAYITSGPLAWDGAFGRVPYFITSAVYGTQAAVNTAAVAELARLRRTRSQVLTISCVANAALEVGDTITLQAPKGTLTGVTTAIVWPLVQGPMQLSISVDPDELAAVS